MKTAKIRLKMNQFGSSISLKHVTPAEVMLLVAMHHSNVGTVPVTILEETADVTQSPAQEKSRLMSKYNNKKVETMFPGPLPNLPQSFEEAMSQGISIKLPEGNLIEADLAAQ